MTPNDFNSSFRDLLTGSLSSGRDPHSIAAETVNRDHRRLWILAAFSLFFWLLFAVGMLLLLYGLNHFIIFIRIDPALPWNSARGSTTQVDAATSEEMMFWGTDFIHHSLPYIAGSVIALPLAALCSVLLVFSSRQATLKRINFSLMQISARLNPARDPSSAANSSAHSNIQDSYVLPNERLKMSYLWEWVGKIAVGALILILLIVSIGITYIYVANPWCGYATLSPFQAVQWQQEVPQVEVNGTWYQLLAINDIPVQKIVEFSKSTGLETWQKHFDEDLVELLTRMGHPPGRSVTLQLRDLNTREVKVLNDVPMTKANRQAIWQGVTTRP